MKKILWFIGILAALLLVLYVLVEKNYFDLSLTEEADTPLKTVELMKRFDEKGNLKSDVEIVNGLRNGEAHNYYNNGSLHSLIHYKNNKKEGLSIWYYENGQPYRETMFEDNMKQGLQKKYYKSGKIMAEIPYKNNVLQPGTKEYSDIGTLIDEPLELTYSLANKAYANQPTLIEINGKDVKKVIAYAAFFTPNSKVSKIQSNRENNTIYFQIPADLALQNNKVYIWLTVNTKMKNKKIVEKQLTIN